MDSLPKSHRAAEGGWEAAGRSISDINRGFQALAAEMTEYSKKTFDDAIHTWEQLIGVKSLEQAIEIQSQYAKWVYENHIAEMTKLGEMYARMVRDAHPDFSLFGALAALIAAQVDEPRDAVMVGNVSNAPFGPSSCV